PAEVALRTVHPARGAGVRARDHRRHPVRPEAPSGGGKAVLEHGAGARAGAGRRLSRALRLDRRARPPRRPHRLAARRLRQGEPREPADPRRGPRQILPPHGPGAPASPCRGDHGPDRRPRPGARSRTARRAPPPEDGPGETAMSDGAPGPTSHTYFSQRLRLHYVDWGNPGAPPLLLLHGGRDHCRNWDWTAAALRRDWPTIAPDLRGHGDSQWSPDGSYTMAGYIYDLAQLIHQQRLAPVAIIAHSLGGNIALRYAGIYPETVAKLVAIEGLGPPPRELDERRS